MKCSVKDCPHEANAGDKCWEHLAAGYDTSISDRFKKRLDESGKIPLPVVDIPPQPTANVTITNAEIDDAIERRRLEDDLIAVEAGRDTWHIKVNDVKKIGIWKIIGAIATFAGWWFSRKKE